MNNIIFLILLILSCRDDRYSPYSGNQSPQTKSLSLQMPFAQGKDGKPFLNFGKKVFEDMRGFEGGGRGTTLKS